MSWFPLASWAAWALVVALAAFVRGRPFVFFVAVLVGVETLVAVALAPMSGPLFPVYAYLQGAVCLHFALLSAPRMRPFVYRALVSLPASWFMAATLLAVPWAIAHARGFHPWGLAVPYAVAFAGLVDSFVSRPANVDIVIGAESDTPLVRVARKVGGDERPLRIVQITDPHLGPFMSASRLAKICARAVAESPDLVLLTGDFLTMESQHDETLLGRALMPLAALDGRCFACLGNHDLEAPAHVRAGLAAAGVRLLVDESARIETGAGPVEILGFDFRFRDRKAHLEEVAARHPRREGALRVALLHDPGAFRHLPPGTADLVLSGHTHGGQLGLLWLGLPHTIVSALSQIPDHGLWQRGRDLLYVHRGTGHYGFPLRLGVPPEESVLRLHRTASS
jgi:predicted MPP superfamily phosphohydrolase